MFQTKRPKQLMTEVIPSIIINFTVTSSLSFRKITRDIFKWMRSFPENGIEIKTYSERCPFLFFLQYFLISVCFVILSSPAVANDAWDRLLPPPPEQCSAILFVCLTSNTLFVCLFVSQVKLFLFVAKSNLSAYLEFVIMDDFLEICRAGLNCQDRFVRCSIGQHQTIFFCRLLDSGQISVQNQKKIIFRLLDSILPWQISANFRFPLFSHLHIVFTVG